MVHLVQHLRHESGIPLGGIGAGSIEIRPDGLFHEWQIFNLGQWSPGSACGCGAAPEVSSHELLFLVRAKTPGRPPVVRYLALDSSLHDLYSFAWLKCVERIDFEGRFPFARLRYSDPDLPVRIEAECFSPFIPHDSRASATPGFLVRFDVDNPGDEPVEVSILGRCPNLAGLGQRERRNTNRLHTGNGVTVEFGADNTGPEEATTGSMAFSLTGGAITYVSGAHAHDHRLQYVEGRYGYKHYTYYYPFRETGRLPNLHVERRLDWPPDYDAAKQTESERAESLKQLRAHPFWRAKFDTIQRAQPDLASNPEHLIAFLNDTAADLKNLGNQAWGVAALCSRMDLAPGESGDCRFGLAWHFPNHRSPRGQRIGHCYEAWFDGALAVSRHLNAHAETLRARSRVAPQLLYEESTLPPLVADAVNSQLATLTKATWWTADDHFGVWEGLGCCGFHTTDITYQGSFPLIALFPDLQRRQMLHGAKFQREDGRVHHLFQPDFDKVDDDFARVDMNPQFVMLVARDFEWTGDRESLAPLWPAVIRAMDSIRVLDTDGDGLPDTETRRNTYDVWNFAGCPSYIASLWLGALRAGARLARAMGDGDREREWTDLLEQAAASFERLLWTGEQYLLWKDPATGAEDRSCMTDQLSGDWFSAVCGWGPLVNPERIRQALATILRRNFRPGTGLLNATCPEDAAPALATVANLQADATWTGIEYAFASLLVEHGMTAEALTIVADIHDRYVRAGRFWNHVECGGHYYRALASWSLLISLSGFRVNQSTAEWTFAPALERPQALPFFAPGVAGLIRWDADGHVAIEVRAGSMTVRQLRVTGVRGERVAKNDCRLEVIAEDTGVRFPDGLELRAGDRLHLR